MYNLEMINTRDEADQLLRMAQREKRTMAARKESLAVRNENASENEAERTANIQSVQAQINSSNALISALPEGQEKEEEITKRMALEVRLRRLTQGGNDDSAVAIVERAFDAEQLGREIEGVDAFLTAVEARKTELP